MGVHLPRPGHADDHDGWLHRYPAFAADYGVSRRLRADVLNDRLIELVDWARPSALRAALKHARHRTAVLSSKAWDPDDRSEKIVVTR